mgnify:CR=1 FL=1
MPGLHSLISMDNIQPIRHDERRIFVNTLDKMKHFQWYVTDVLYNNANMIIGRSYYNGYPFAVFQSKKGVTLIDGAIYNKSNRKVKRELNEISLAVSPWAQLLDKVKKFLLTTHGEFIVMKYNEEMQKCLIFNDALGRLPLYHCSFCNRFSDKIVMSREVKFIIPFLKKNDFDILALAEYLLFGYPLGERTLWKGIKRLPPAAILMMDTKNNKFLLKKVLSWNLEPKSETMNQLREETRNLVNLFLSSSKNIAQTFSKEYSHVVSLSGGLDSRATLAGLVKIGANPIAYSFPAGENRIAKKIAQTLKVRHQVISSSFKITNEDYVKLTDCFSTPKLCHIVSYLYSVRERVGNKAILYTGDGGDKTVGPLGFKFNISDVEKLLQYIIETDHIFDVDEISSVLNIHKGAFKEHLTKHIMAFPEKTMEGKFVHFKVFERGFKWMFVGEDRNRFFLWSTTPFYSIRFFRASMKMSQRFKEHYILYKDFLSGLNLLLSQIQYYNRLIPLSIPNWLLKLYLSVFEWLKKHFHEPGTTSPIDLLSGKRAQERTDEMRKLILQFLGEKNVFNFLDQSRVREIIKKTTNQAKLDILAALVVYASLAKSACARN